MSLMFSGSMVDQDSQTIWIFEEKSHLILFPAAERRRRRLFEPFMNIHELFQLRIKMLYEE